MPYFSGLPGSEWNDNPGATVAARNPLRIDTGGGGYETFGNVGNVGGWDASLAEMKRLNPDQEDQWYIDELANMGLKPGNTGSPDMSKVMPGASANNWMQVSGRQPGGFAFQLKSGNKEGTIIDYNRVGDEWVPTVRGKTMWNTNEGAEMNKLAIMSMLGIAGGALLAPAAVGAEAAAAGGTMGVVEGATAPGLLAAEQAAANTPGWVSTLKDAYDVYNTGKKIYNGYNTLSGIFGGGEGQAGGARSQMPGGAGGGSDMGWLDQLFNMGGSNYSANMNDNYADEMRNQQAKLEAERRPYVERLNNSYLNPKEFTDGVEGQAIADVAANRFTRADAARGNLANDTDRTNLLNKHMMTALEAHRGGLRSDLQQFDQKHIQDMFMKQAEMERMKNSPLFAGAAYGAGGGQGSLTPQMIEMLKQIPGGLQYLQSMMPTSTWGSQPGAPGADPNYGTGGLSGEQYPVDGGYMNGSPYYSDMPYEMPSDDISNWFEYSGTGF